MIRRECTAILAACLAAGLGCHRYSGAEGLDRVEAVPPLAGKIRITGSSTMAPLLEAIGRKFQSLEPGVRVEVETGGTARGLADVRAGRSDIGMFGRAPGEEESDVFAFPIARDGVSLIVHTDNPVADLPAEAIARIYRGIERNWSSFGGRDAAIHVIGRSPGRSQFELFTSHLGLAPQEMRVHAVIGDNASLIESVAANRDAIAYVSIGEAEHRARAGMSIKLLSVDGFAATIQNVRSGDFPISRPLTLIVRGRPRGLVKEFIDFCLSSQVTSIVRENDFIPYLD